MLTLLIEAAILFAILSGVVWFIATKIQQFWLSWYKFSFDGRIYKQL